MAHDFLCGRAKEHAPESSAPMRGDDDQINLALTRDTHNLCRSVSVNDALFNLKSGTLITFSNFWQLARGGIFQLVADVRNRQRLCNTRVADGRDDRFYHMHADNRSLELARQRRSIRERATGALAKIRRQQDRTNLHKR